MRAQSFSYLVDSKRLFTPEEARLAEWDLFISAYNDSERVKKLFDTVRAARKFWWIIPEYGYGSAEGPVGTNTIRSNHSDEAELIQECLEGSGFSSLTDKRICIDITGFMRPQILFLLKYLRTLNVKQFDMLYSEPKHYARKAETTFSMDEGASVRSIAGYFGQHSIDMSNDVLIVGIGYDHNLIAHVIRQKESSRLVQLHSFPSLSADMYHESILRLDRVSSAGTGVDGEQIFYSSANDPFVTAAVLSDAYEALKQKRRVTNLYLSPLATKPQALGFGIFFLRELENAPASLLFPISKKYSRETSSGIGRSWLYPIVF